MAAVLGFGACLPERVVGNEELAGRLGIEAGWILEASGIRERRWADQESVVDLAEGAAREALTASRLETADLGGIIVGTGTPERQFPGSRRYFRRVWGGPGFPPSTCTWPAAAGSLRCAWRPGSAPPWGRYWWWAQRG